MSELDLVVIGGGVLGTTTAVLAKLDHPEWTVRIVERDRVGHGATGASAGLSFPTARNAWQASLVKSSEQGYARLLTEIPGLPVHDIDVLWVLGLDRVPELAKRLVGGAPVTPSEPQLAAMEAAYPDLVLKPGEIVLTTSQRCFYTYPAAIVEQLVAWLRAGDPNTVWEGIGAKRVERLGDSWRVSLTDNRALTARRVVTAIGPWPSGELLPRPFLAPKLRVKKVAALHLALQPPAGSPCVVLWEDDAFLLPLPERGHCLFSYTSTTWDVDPLESIALTGVDVDAALAVLDPRSVELAGLYAGGRAFCDAYTTDFVAALEVRDRLAEIGGCSGSGVRLAPGLAAAALAAVS